MSTPWVLTQLSFLGAAGMTDPGTGEAIPLAMPDATIPHWWAPDLAARWLAFANGMWQRQGPYVRLPTVENPGPSIRARWEFIQSLFAALANVYNCLNVCWYNDPAARALYRVYISGPPAGDTPASIAEHIYARDLPYADGGGEDAGTTGWWNGRMEWRWPTARQFGGRIPGATKDLIDTHRWGIPAGAQRPIGMFQQFGGLRLDKGKLWVGTDTIENVARLPAEYAKEAQNTLFPWAGAEVPVNAPPGYIPQGTAPRYCWNPRTRRDCPNTDYDPVVVAVPDGTSSINVWGYYTDPFEVRYDGNFLGGAFFAAPLADYVAWLGEWLAALNNRSLAAVAVQAIRFATWSNQQQMTRSRMGAEEFLQLALNTPVDVQRAQTAGQPGWRTAGAITSAIGAGLAPFTFGISALVGAGLGIGMEALARQWANPQTTFKDDLGRPKPILERATLGGDPGTPTEYGMPTMQVPEPPPLPPPDRTPIRTIQLSPEAMAAYRGSLGGPIPLNPQLVELTVTRVAAASAMSKVPASALLAEMYPRRVWPWVLGVLLLLGGGIYLATRPSGGASARRAKEGEESE